MADHSEYYKNQIALARTEIKNLRQQLTSLKHEHQKEIKLIKAALNSLRCSDCAEAATTALVNNVEAERSDDDIHYQPIGSIETSFQNKRGVPRQPSVMKNARGTVVIDTSVFNNPEHALSGLEEFSHMWIIFHFHMTESTNAPAKVAPPRLCGGRQGVFSTRSPHRPCPIGLSLVKIHSIEGNKIHFLGVDMVNGTPVLDIKPYIPQYDYPYEATSSVRPRTEGISNVVDDMVNVNIGDHRLDIGSLSSRIATPIDIDSPCRSPFEDIPSPESRLSNMQAPLSEFPDSPSGVDHVDGNPRSPLRRPDAERGDPDGQERFTPPQSANQSIRHDGIRVAAWINNPASQRYDVRFTDDALARLHDLIGDRADAFKSNIESLLSEDPRSNYVRGRYPDHEYSCVLEDLSISCVFDRNSHVCNIIAVRNAEELQEN
uniref:TsaA-like domain-containing protein n=1 Tax=Bombyx mori TaxID=7091 RepID=A0A8R1WLR7_BOMMO|nr:tRNA (adenine(37)-N6)-methyltransferase isoform X1 [Bombyx mori]